MTLSKMVVLAVFVCSAADYSLAQAPVPAAPAAPTLAERVQALEARVNALQPRALPPGTVIFLQASICPHPFVEATSVRGRYVVGLNPGGTPGTTVGDALADKEQRNRVSYHNHSIQPEMLKHTHHVGAIWSGYQQGALPFTEGSNYNRIDIVDTGPANFTHGGADKILTDAYGQLPENQYTNAPYVQLIACIIGG